MTARRPRPGATATAAWPAVGDRCPSALDPTPAPRVHVPLFRPLEANPEIGTPTPPDQYAPSGNFSKKSFPENYPPRDGTRAQKFQTIFDRGITQWTGSQIPLKKAFTRFCGGSSFDQGVSPGSRGVIAGGNFGKGCRLADERGQSNPWRSQSSSSVVWARRASSARHGCPPGDRKYVSVWVEQLMHECATR